LGCDLETVQLIQEELGDYDETGRHAYRKAYARGNLEIALWLAAKYHIDAPESIDAVLPAACGNNSVAMMQYLMQIAPQSPEYLQALFQQACIRHAPRSMTWLIDTYPEIKIAHKDHEIFALMCQTQPQPKIGKDLVPNDAMQILLDLSITCEFRYHFHDQIYYLIGEKWEHKLVRSCHLVYDQCYVCSIQLTALAQAKRCLRSIRTAKSARSAME